MLKKCIYIYIFIYIIVRGFILYLPKLIASWNLQVVLTSPKSLSQYEVLPLSFRCNMSHAKTLRSCATWGKKSIKSSQKSTWQVITSINQVISSLLFVRFGTKLFGRIPFGDRDQKIGASNSKHSIQVKMSVCNFWVNHGNHETKVKATCGWPKCLSFDLCSTFFVMNHHPKTLIPKLRLPLDDTGDMCFCTQLMHSRHDFCQALQGKLQGYWAFGYWLVFTLQSGNGALEITLGRLTHTQWSRGT